MAVAELMYILHLEDSVDDAEIVAETLSDGGLRCYIERVDQRDTFLSALDRREWDAIIADYSLPSFDGLSALVLVREKYPDLPFILVSGTLGEEAAVEALKSGANDYIIKDRLARLPLATKRAIEERAAIQERKESEALLNLRTKALESAANSVIITDRQGTIIWANPACAALTGYTPSELIGHNPRLFNSGHHDRAFHQHLWTTILQGNVWQGEMHNRRKDGSLYYEEMTITPVRDAKGEIDAFIAIKQDVSVRKDLEQQLLHSQKMEAVGRLAGGVAHDFNNLLTVITGYSNMLLTDPKVSVSECAEQIKTASERAAALVRQLLMFSRREVFQPRVVSLNDIIFKTEKLLLPVLGEKVKLVTAKGSGVGSVKADPAQIQQMIINLAINAGDAMPRGGQLSIATSNANVDESTPGRPEWIAPGPYVLLKVADNGLGMSEEVKAQIFEPFFTTKDRSSGRGLGLSSVYGIVKQNGGFIHVESALNQGSTFSVYLPRVQAEAETGQRGAHAQHRGDGAGTVLVVEDEVSVRTLVRSVLELDGYTVLEAGDPDEALTNYGVYLWGSSSPIDLLLTDIVMPQMSGIELAAQLLPLHPKMKVLYMSGYSDELLEQQGIRSLSRSAFIPKPFTSAELLSRIEEALTSGD